MLQNYWVLSPSRTQSYDFSDSALLQIWCPANLSSYACSGRFTGPCPGGSTASAVWSVLRGSSRLHSDSNLACLFVFAGVLPACEAFTRSSVVSGCCPGVSSIVHQGFPEAAGDPWGQPGWTWQITITATIILQLRLRSSAFPAITAGSAPACSPPWGEPTQHSHTHSGLSSRLASDSKPHFPSCEEAVGSGLTCDACGPALRSSPCLSLAIFCCC